MAGELSGEIPLELARALRILLEENLADRIYHVRESEGQGWEGPRVTAYGHACEVVGWYAMTEDDFDKETELDRAERLVLGEKEWRRNELEHD